MRVLLFPTCLVDQCWPEVGLATARLLREVGVEIAYDPALTCCGQPFANSGYPATARPLAERLIEGFERSGAAALVAPSGSCVAQVHHYASLFPDAPQWQQRAEALAAQTTELSQFLLQRGLAALPGRLAARVVWHDACHGLRDLGIESGPRQLLRRKPGVELVEMRDAAACCGFGGTFAVALDGISVAIADHKLDQVQASGAEVLCSGDASCLLHLRGRLQRRGLPIRTMHLAEALAHGLEER